MVKKKEPTRREQLQLLMDECNAALKGSGELQFGNDVKEYEHIPTGLLAFDTVTGGGLVPRTLLELYGEDSGGKTLLAMMCVAAMQKKGKSALWVAGEEFDKVWFERNGGNLKELVLLEGLDGDTMLETAASMIESGLIDVCVLDSYQVFGTSREAEDGIEKESYGGGGAPQMWGRFGKRCRRAFRGGLAETIMIGISQVRDPIGVMAMPGRPKPEPRPTQIKALKHWKAISIQCKKGEPQFTGNKENGRKNLVSREFHLRCMKNKTAPPERVSSYTFHFGKGRFGVDRLEEVVRFAKVYELIHQKGAILEGYGIRVKSGKDSDGEKVKGDVLFMNALAKRPEVMRELYTDIIHASTRVE